MEAEARADGADASVLTTTMASFIYDIVSEGETDLRDTSSESGTSAQSELNVRQRGDDATPRRIQSRHEY